MYARVPGEGPCPADCLILGDMPGPEEARVGRPFAGRAGRELRHKLNGYTVPVRPSECYISNLSKTPAKDVKSMVFSAEDEQDLWHEIAMVRPKVILTCGARVTRYFLGDGVTLEMTHGIPHAPCAAHDYKWPGGPHPIILPTYNPAAALYVPALQSISAYDLERFGLLLKGKIAPPVQDDRPMNYRLLTGKEVKCVLSL
jgi:DNA polymerase